jgi:hypothetical protein
VAGLVIEVQSAGAGRPRLLDALNLAPVCPRICWRRRCCWSGRAGGAVVPARKILVARASRRRRGRELLEDATPCRRGTRVPRDFSRGARSPGRHRSGWEARGWGAVRGGLGPGLMDMEAFGRVRGLGGGWRSAVGRKRFLLAPLPHHIPGICIIL